MKSLVSPSKVSPRQASLSAPTRGVPTHGASLSAPTRGTLPSGTSSPERNRIRALLVVVLAVLLALSLVPVTQLQRAFAANEQTVSLISPHDIWSYDDTGADLFGASTTDFRSTSYDDSTWESGASPLGYPQNAVSVSFGLVSDGGTLLDEGAPDTSVRYFRKDFTVENIADITRLEAQIASSDGYVLSINGNEIARSNMPAGVVGYNTLPLEAWAVTEARASSTVDLTAYRQFLVEGVNTIAVDVHSYDSSGVSDGRNVSSVSDAGVYWGMTLHATYSLISPLEATDVNKTPRQVNVHVGTDPSSAVNITYTTIASDATKVVVQKTSGTGSTGSTGGTGGSGSTGGSTTPNTTGETLTFTGEASIGSGNKYIHKIAVTGLEADSSYVYSVGNEVTFDGRFKTAPQKGSTETIKFVYLADTQVSNATNAKALGATLQEVASMNPDFVYLAGDITDTSTNESQWEQLFTNGGSFPIGGQDMFGNYLIAAVQGNHDNNTFNRHINAPTLASNSIENRIVYSFDYGPITFIMLNLDAAGSDANARAAQEAFLRAAVADAKARGQWTAVGFHKSLITGASHIVDSDVVTARKFWVPKFAELDVDMVLQGHDHVYSRGFVTADGYAAPRTTNADGSINQPANAPLYMIGGHAGGLKWYARINYTVGTGDPLAPGYTFLDIDSASPADNADGITSDIKQEQVIVELEVSQAEVTVNTYMFKYDTTTDTITTSKYLYDSMTLVREVPATPTSASIVGPNLAIAETDQLINYTVSYSDLVNSNAFDTTIEYDDAVLELVSTTSIFGSATYEDVSYPAQNRVRVINGSSSIIPALDAEVVRFTFRAKQPVVVDDTTVWLVQADTVKRASATSNPVVVTAVLAKDAQTTTLYTYRKAADIDKDGQVTLADLALALEHYQSTAVEDRIYDIDLSGVVDALDYTLICSFLKG